MYHLRQPFIEALEIRDDDNNDEEELDNILAVTVTQGEMHALMEEEEEDKEEEAHEEEKDEDELVRIVVEVIESFPHTPPNTITSVELASTMRLSVS